MIIIDCIFEHRPPFDPSIVVAEIAELLRSYFITELVGDAYAANWVVESFAKVGVTYRKSERNKSSLFLDCLPLFASGRIRLVESQRAIHQFISLQRRSTRGGRDIVSHPANANAHDDVANSIAGAATLAASAAAPSLWRRSDLLTDGQPALWPQPVGLIYASAAADLSGISAFFWAASLGDGPLLLVDFDLNQPMTPTRFQSIRDRLRTLAAEAHAPTGGMITTAALAAMARTAAETEVLQHLERHDFEAAKAAELDTRPDADPLLVDRDALALAAAQAIGAGRCRVCGPAHEKSLRSPLPLFSFRQGMPVDAATDSAMVGLISGCTDARSFPRLNKPPTPANPNSRR